MRLTALLLGVWLGVAASTAAPTPADTWIVGTNQANHRIECYDFAEKEWNHLKAVRWSFGADAPDYTPEEVVAWRLPSDARFRTTSVWPGTAQVMLAVSSGGLATIVDYPSGRRLWSAIVGGNPHASELLPNGNLAVAASHGNYVRVYASSQGARNTEYASFPLEDAHGASWDPVNERLWVIGRIPGAGDVITALVVGGTAATPTLTEDTSRRRALPDHGPHDLSPCYDAPGKFWVTSVPKGYVFDTTTGEFVDLPGVASGENIKALSSFKNGMLVETRATGGCYAWTTDTVLFFDGTSGHQVETRVVQGACFYKARAWSDRYR